MAGRQRQKNLHTNCAKIEAVIQKTNSESMLVTLVSNQKLNEGFESNLGLPVELLCWPTSTSEILRKVLTRNRTIFEKVCYELLDVLFLSFFWQLFNKPVKICKEWLHWPIVNLTTYTILTWKNIFKISNYNFTMCKQFILELCIVFHHFKLDQDYHGKNSENDIYK